MTTYIIDTETTGLNEPEVIELAVKKLTNLDIGGFYWAPVVSYYRPSKPIELGAMATHHITSEELQDYPPASTAKIPEDAEFIIGHNVDFDWAALGSPSVKRICAQALARMLYPELDSHRLGALMYHLRPDVAKERLKEAHSAAVDVENCWLILMEMLVELEDKGYVIDGFEALWGISERARIPTVMTFGKHKGMRIADVPRSYASWYERQEQTDPYLLEAFRRAGLIGGRRK